MDWQTAFAAILGLAMAALGWWARIMWDSIRSLQNEMNDFQQHVSETYIRRDDYRDDMVEIKSMLRQIFEMINNKADKK